MNALPASPRTVDYRIDVSGRIRHLGVGWDSAVQREGAAHLISANVANQSIWHYITDGTTRFIYRLLVDRVRLRQMPMRLTARCDSPAERRTIEIEMHPAANQQIHFISTFVAVEPRDPVALLDSAIPRAESYVIICSWCKRIELSDGRWVEIEEAVQRLDLLNRMPLPKLSHGMCVGCLLKMQQEIVRQG